MTFSRESYTIEKEQYMLKGINDLVDYFLSYSYYNEL